MRAWLLGLAACGGAPGAVANPGPPAASTCGFASFAALDAAAREAARSSTTEVGTCRLHAIDAARYAVRDGEREVAQVAVEGTLLLVPGLTVDGFAVGMSTDVVLERHPPDVFRIACMPSGLGNLCEFRRAFTEQPPVLAFFVDGELRGQLDGVAAYEFFRHKRLRGVQRHTRS